MKSIIVPVNFSPCAINAARYAADFALAIKADLHLIHVIQVPVSSAEMLMTESVYQEMVDSANISLKELQVELIRRTHEKIGIDTSVEAGSLSTNVANLCNELQPCTVVLGATGPTIEKFLAGSPVASLLHRLKYPVLVVPEDLPFRHFRRILMACDLEDINSGMAHSLPLLKDLRTYFGSRFDIVTVEKPQVTSNEPPIFKSGAWKEQLKELYPEVHCIQNQRVDDGILEYLGYNNADLILVFPKKHGLFDFHVSQSRKLAQHSPIPVLSLHE